MERIRKDGESRGASPPPPPSSSLPSLYLPDEPASGRPFGERIIADGESRGASPPSYIVRSRLTAAPRSVETARGANKAG